ncbi:MAG TPA: hypothetical protein VFX15_07710 [Actinomycetes bacterium]|nr:hypothetical protein [Actinomycetes bacterium]
MLVSLAVVATGISTAPPASADDEVVASTTYEADPTSNVIKIELQPNESILVTNPGLAVPLAQGCLMLPNEATLCVGGPDQGRSIQQPLTFNGLDTMPMMDQGPFAWIAEEAVNVVAALHGVAADDMVRGFAKAEIRAYIYVRLLDILDKWLYQEPMTPDERDAAAWIMRILEVRERNKAVRAYKEFTAWEDNPCGYNVPPPPTPDFPGTSNPIAKLATCQKGTLAQTFEFTSNMPRAATFERWASYRNPSDLAVMTKLPAFREAIASTNRALASLAAVAGSVAAAALVGISMAGVTALVSTGLTSMLWLTAGMTGFSLFTILSTTTIVGFVLLALAVAAVGFWQIAEDIKTWETLRDRAKTPVEVIRDDDLDNYAGLDYMTREEPGDSSKIAFIHTDKFRESLFTWLIEEGLVSVSGKLISDAPPDGYTEPQHTASDDVFHVTSIVDTGTETLTEPVTKEWVPVRAPNGTYDGAGNLISGYKVWFARGWLMVSPFKNGAYQRARPQLSLEYVEPDGDDALMTVIERKDETTQQVIRQFSLSSKGGDATFSDSWAFKSGLGREMTTELEIVPPRTPKVSLLPTATGHLVTGSNVTLAANVSSPGASVDGVYSWSIDRYEDGRVAQTWTWGEEENLTAFQRKFNKPGHYVARVRYRGTEGGAAFDTSGTVAFDITPPVPELYDTNLDEPRLYDDLVLNGRLFLDLRMMEPVPSDTFDVAIEWANSGSGDRIVRHYTVKCIPVGDGTCETGALVSPASAPVNPQWSSSPSYKIPIDQTFLPNILVRVTNSQGVTVERVFQMPGEHRPSFADAAPTAEMVAGAFSRVRVTEAIPSALLPDQGLSIFQFVNQIQAQLPEGTQLELVEDAGHTYVEIFGTPLGDQIGPHLIEVPIEQQPVGSGYLGSPTTVLLDVVSSVDPGYRAILRNTPTSPIDRSYRKGFPNWYVQVALRADPMTQKRFKGTVMCKLTRFGAVVFEKPCEQDALFPFPKDRDGDYQVTVWTESATQTVAGPPFTVNFSLAKVWPSLTVKPPRNARRDAVVRLEITDLMYNGTAVPIPTPFREAGYKVWCSVDGKKKDRCLDSGKMRIRKAAGRHELAIEVRAPDGTTVRDRVKWRVPG